VAILSVRYPSLLSAGLERLTFIGFALPGVAVALAFVFFATSHARPLYQTSFLLVIAYLVLFLPAAVGATQASLRQVSPRLEEAARGLGKTSFQAFRAITLPLLSRGILAGAALVFMLTMKELPATLILAPIGFDTLATSVWSAASEAFFARAAMPALLLVLAAAIPMAMVVIREGKSQR
jgi:iron(III) transport system permease protein